MKTEKVFWAGLSVISMSFVMMFTYFFMMVVFPFHVAEVKKRAGETVYHLQTVMPHLQPEIRQTYLQGLSQKAEDLSYLLLMDMHGTALAHSNPDRVGMNFDDPGFRRCLATGQRAEQLYVRDADKPSSPYHNEKTIDILDIYHTADGLVGGVVNVGISLAAIEKIKGKYITVSAIAVIFWLVFISVFAVVHFRTMHQKRKTDKALSDSERRLSQAIAASSDAIWEWNLLSGRTYYSPRWYTMLGYADEEFEMTIDQWKALCHPADLQPTLDLVQAAIVAHGNLGYEAEFRMRHKQGDWRWILGRGNVVGFDGDDKPLMMGGTNTDITERKGHEEKLRESEARYRRIIENIADVYYRTDKDGNLIIVSPSGVCLLGYDSAGEMLGRPNAFFWANPQERLNMLAMLQSKGSVSDYEVVLQRRDGSLVQVSTSSGYYRDQHGEIQGVEGIFRDITERKRAEKEWKDLQGQLLHAQKMEAVGRLAGGVAHDFNNMLVVIMGRAELALMKTSSSHPLHADLLEISMAAERSAGLTRHLLAFARKQTVSPQVLDLNITIEKMLTMHRRLIGEDIELEWLPGQGLTPVKIDPSQVDQLLVNLCVNARDAISGVGKVTIKTENVFLDTAFCAKHAGLIPGGYVALAVCDSGCGMDQDVLDHIFEPFFTTKGEKGTGIGLATVFGIVKQNEGGVTVKSARGTGTTFTIYLPGYAEHIQATESLSSFETMKGNGETILLVEDESTIIELGKVMLEALNYQVLPAGTPEEALDLAENHAGKIHLLITDVIMPQMNGRDLAARILAMRQDIRCLFMSGYTADIIGERGVLEESINFMQKPFSMQGLADKVQAALKRKTPGLD